MYQTKSFFDINFVVQGKSRIRETVYELRSFFLGFLNNAREVGSIFPTSGIVAKEMCVPLFDAIRKGHSPKVLEIGAGTGSITRHLFKVSEKCQKLTICECNPFYIKFLREKFSKNLCAPNVFFFDNPIQSFNVDEKYDFIICSLPFLSLDVEVNLDIFRKIKNLSNPKTVMTFYEHAGLRQLNLVFDKSRRQIYKVIDQITLFERMSVLNYFPIKVIGLRPYFLAL